MKKFTKNSLCFTREISQVHKFTSSQVTHLKNYLGEQNNRRTTEEENGWNPPFILIPIRLVSWTKEAASFNPSTSPLLGPGNHNMFCYTSYTLGPGHCQNFYIAFHLLGPGVGTGSRERDRPDHGEQSRGGEPTLRRGRDKYHRQRKKISESRTGRTRNGSATPAVQWGSVPRRLYFPALQ